MVNRLVSKRVISMTVVLVNMAHGDQPFGGHAGLQGHKSM
jgi:hypothetical protein